MVAYAIGINPDQDDDWYDAKRMAFGGDDGTEFLSAEEIEPVIENRPDTDYLEIRISETAIKVMAGTVPKEKAASVAL